MLLHYSIKNRIRISFLAALFLVLGAGFSLPSGRESSRMQDDDAAASHSTEYTCLPSLLSSPLTGSAGQRRIQNKGRRNSVFTYSDSLPVFCFTSGIGVIPAGSDLPSYVYSGLSHTAYRPIEYIHKSDGKKRV